uniref:Leucine rich immune protein (Short) n=1 Tax=Anopheles stephensi TaxID=30069 RepID=A0A182Y0W8_ANOST
MHFGLADASVWLMLIAVRLQLCTCSKYTCTISSDGFCIFQGVHIESPEQAANVQLEPPAGAAADVTRVKFRDSSMFMLPAGLYSAFRQLQELRVWWMHLHSIHIDPRLLSLDAEKNRISSITTDPGTVPLLRKLELNQNRLRNIDNISVFENLEILELAHNDLRTLDLCVFQRMSKLRLLDLSSNNLALVRSSIGPEKLTSLTVLYLNDNRLTYLDLSVLRSFPALEKVHLANNALVYVDHDSLPTMLPRLRVFHLQSNDWHCEALTELVGQLRKTGVQDFKTFSAFTCKERMVEGVCCTENKPFSLVRKSNQYLANYATELNGHTRHLMRELQHTRHEVARLIANDNYTQVSLQNIGDEVEELRNQLTDALAAPDPVTGRPVKPTTASRPPAGGSVNPERLVAEVAKLRRDFQKMAGENQTLRQQLRQYDKLRQELEALRTDTTETKLSFQLVKEENALLRQDLRQLEQKLQQLFSRGAVPV